MVMKIVPGGEPFKVAIINPKIPFGNDGQYIAYEDSFDKIIKIVEEARSKKCEIRWYYKDIEAENGEAVASQIIVTEIPPQHVQPFHTHKTLHEMTLVLEGEIVAIDSDKFTENTYWEDMASTGEILGPMMMVIEGPGTRHTIANYSESYAKTVTVQTARIPLTKFPHDWHRDK